MHANNIVLWTIGPNKCILRIDYLQRAYDLQVVDNDGILLEESAVTADEAIPLALRWERHFRAVS